MKKSWVRKLRKEYQRAIREREEEAAERLKFRWESLFTVTRQTGVLLGVLVAALIVCYFAYHIDRGPPPPPTYPAQGHIEARGVPPFAGGEIRFRPENHAGLIVAGEIDSEGSFNLHTIRGRHRAEGAPEGAYQVSIVLPQSSRRNRTIVLPTRYVIFPQENNLTVVVTKDQLKK